MYKRYINSIIIIIIIIIIIVFFLTPGYFFRAPDNSYSR